MSCFFIGSFDVVYMSTSHINIDVYYGCVLYIDICSDSAKSRVVVTMSSCIISACMRGRGFI